MDNTNQNQPSTTPPPVIPESELKLPEEGVNGVTPAPAPKYAINPLLIGLLVLLLAVLAAVIIWGEQLIGLVLPEDTVELPPLPEEQARQDSADELSELEAEIDQSESELNALEQELNQMEAEIEASAAAEASATGTPAN